MGSPRTTPGESRSCACLKTGCPGDLPPALGSLVNLRVADLSGNQLGGALPPELGQLASLEQLWLNNNQLSGELPPELGRLANLTLLGLGGNPAERGDPHRIRRSLQPEPAIAPGKPVGW